VGESRNYFKIKRAIEPLERDGNFDFNASSKPYKYSVALENERVEIKNIMLTPEQFVQKVYARHQEIDPAYGDSWIDKEPICLVEREERYSSQNPPAEIGRVMYQEQMVKEYKNFDENW